MPGKNIFICKLLILISFGICSADNINWVIDWQIIQPDSLATGTAVQNNDTINVSYTGHINHISQASYFNEYDPPPYTGNDVIDNAPTSGITLSAANTASPEYANRISFSRSVKNPVIALYSVGTGSVGVPYEFDQPFTLLSEGYGTWGNGSYTISGDTLTGYEFHGAIQFHGEISSIAWNNPVPEYHHGFSIGVIDSVANAAPLAVDDYINVWEDSTAIFQVTRNDSDSDGKHIYITRAYSVLHGMVSFDEGDSLVYYTPDTDFFGADSFFYIISDSDGAIDTGKVVINVISVNDAPYRTLLIPDTSLTRDSHDIFYRNLNTIFSDKDIYDMPLDSFYTHSSGLVSASVRGDSLFLSSNGLAGMDTVMITTVDDSNAVATDTFIVEIQDITVLEEVITPGKFSLGQNYPNPFNPKTIIEYNVGAYDHTQVELSVYNLIGQKVATLVDKKQTAGNYKVEWDASGFSSGVYIYTIETDTGFRQSRKLILLK